VDVKVLAAAARGLRGGALRAKISRIVAGMLAVSYRVESGRRGLYLLTNTVGTRTPRRSNWKG
jgi:hypothetical protein